MSIARVAEPPARGPMVPAPTPIRNVVRETSDTVTLRLEPAEPFRFAAGQFNMLYLFGGGEVAISLSGDPKRKNEIVHTVRAVGSVTVPLTALRRGDFLGVRGPFGTSWPLADARGRDLVLVAGGIGLAPLRPVLYHCARQRNDFARIVLLVGARSPADLLYVGEIERLAKSRRIDVRMTVDRADVAWTGEVGVVTALLEGIELDPARTLAMLCGPEVMMRFAIRELEKHGVPPASIWLSLERNMKCAVGHCGHCQLGPAFLCKDGPVFRLDRVTPFFGRREL